MHDRWLPLPRWCIVTRQDIQVIREPRRIRRWAMAEAAFRQWRYPRRAVTVEPNQ